MSCCTCWAFRRWCRPRSPPTRWSANACRALLSRCSRRRSVARNSCWARPWRCWSLRLRSHTSCTASSSPAWHCSRPQAWRRRSFAARTSSPSCCSHAHRRLVDLDRHRDLGANERRPRCTTARDARQPPHDRCHDPDRGQRDPRLGRTSRRRRGRAAARRPTRLAAGFGHVRPRTACDRGPLVRRLGDVISTRYGHALNVRLPRFGSPWRSRIRIRRTPRGWRSGVTGEAASGRRRFGRPQPVRTGAGPEPRAVQPVRFDPLRAPQPRGRPRPGNPGGDRRARRGPRR